MGNVEDHGDTVPPTEAARSGTPTRLTQLSRYVRDHWSWLTPVFALLTLSLKVLAVADFHFVTAAAVLESVGSADMAVGLVLTGLPPVVGLLTAMLLAGFIGEAIRESDPWPPPAALYLGFIGFSALFVSWTLLVAYLLLGLVHVLLALAYHAVVGAASNRNLRGAVPAIVGALRSRGNGPLRRQVVPLLVPLAALIWLTMAGSSVPWAPPEVIATSTDRFVGYALGEEGGWLTVLRETPREAVRVQTESIEERIVCQLDPSSGRRVVAVLGFARKPAKYPSCESSERRQTTLTTPSPTQTSGVPSTAPAPSANPLPSASAGPSLSAIPSSPSAPLGP